MQTAWFQMWVTVPVLGRQWAGWLNTDIARAMALEASLKGAALKYEVLDQNGAALPSSQLPSLGQFGLPNLGGI